VLARRQAERDRAADHDELVILRAEKAMLHRENQLLRDQLIHAQKLASNVVASFGKGRAA
jgi:cell division protein FtsB